jgi:hypothetical protein
MTMKRWGRVAMMFAVLALLASVMALPALADPVPTGDLTNGPTTPDVDGPYTIATDAVVGTTGGGGLAGPNIECKWELVDMQAAFRGDAQDGAWYYNEAARQAGSPEFPRVGQLPDYYMDYAWLDPSGNWWYDDDPYTGPDPAFPCTVNPPSDGITGYEVVTSPALGFGDGGYGGWSCPAGKVVLGGGFESTGPVAVSAPGLPGVAWPHYTFGAAEYGWVVRDAPDGAGNTITIYSICADAPPGYSVVNSPALGFGDGGYGGWSCPVGDVVYGGGFDSTGPVAVSAPGLPGVAWPHYTFGASEYGWVIRDDPDGSGNTATVYAICGDEPTNYSVVNSPALGFGDGGYGGWSCPVGDVVLGGGFDSTGPVAVSAPGLPGVAWPHYTFGASEYGWVIRDDPDGSGNTATVYGVCAGTFSNTGGAQQAGGARNMIQVYANAGDATGPGPDGIFGTSDDRPLGPQPQSAKTPYGERIIELWVAVDPPGADLGDIQQVYWDIFHPDNTKKAQVHDRFGYGQELCRNGYDDFLGAGEAVPFDPTSFGIKQENTVMGGAFGTGQVSEEAVESIVTSCAQQQKKLYQSHFTLSKHQPCGEYKVVAHAVPVIGPEDTLTNYFDVLCFIHLDLDYTTVSWTNVNTTGVGYFEGDFDMETGTLPTAINAGSGPLTVVVEFFPMESQTDLNGNPLSGKWLEDFDVSFGVSESSLTALEGPTGPVIHTDQNDPTAGVSTLPNLSPGTTLCSNETGKFIYSLHTSGALPGNYAGEIKVSAVPSEYEHCNNTKVNSANGTMGVWGGYHDLGPDGAADGGGPAGAPVSIGNFDDDYGRNQRTVKNQ